MIASNCPLAHMVADVHKTLLQVTISTRVHERLHQCIRRSRHHQTAALLGMFSRGATSTTGTAFFRSSDSFCVSLVARVAAGETQSGKMMPNRSRTQRMKIQRSRRFAGLWSLSFTCACFFFPLKFVSSNDLPRRASSSEFGSANALPTRRPSELSRMLELAAQFALVMCALEPRR